MSFLMGERQVMCEFSFFGDSEFAFSVLERTEWQKYASKILISLIDSNSKLNF